MNTRKKIDYSDLYEGINKAMTAAFSQMELYRELGRLVSGRPEKGAAVMAAEYITTNYPDRTGFSPRNLRRMRDFYRIYEEYPEVLKQAMKVGWTQNIVIMEADLEMNARLWHLLAVQQFGWSKAELAARIIASAHLEAGNQKNAANNKRRDFSKMLSLWEKEAILFVGDVIAFLDRHWYNILRQNHTFRQTGGIREAYG